MAVMVASSRDGRRARAARAGGAERTARGAPVRRIGVLRVADELDGVVYRRFRARAVRVGRGEHAARVVVPRSRDLDVDDRWPDKEDVRDEIVRRDVVPDEAEGIVDEQLVVAHTHVPRQRTLITYHRAHIRRNAHQDRRRRRRD